MRTVRRNKEKLIYALQTKSKMPVYERDEEGNVIYEGYTDEDGNFIPITDEDGNKTPRKTGEYEYQYSTPVIFYANISFSGSDTQPEFFGLDLSSYDATILVNRHELPITETSVIWYDSEPVYLDDDETIPDPDSADYQVKKKLPSLNYEIFALEKRIK